MEKDSKKIEEIVKRLDLISAILLAQSGFKRIEIAKILSVSDKTIERMFVGNFKNFLRKNQSQE